MREDLSIPQQAVQACHAAIKAARSFLRSETDPENPNLVVCTIADRGALLEFFEGAWKQGVACVAFFEDDMQGEITAIASELVSGEKRKVFRDRKSVV